MMYPNFSQYQPAYKCRTEDPSEAARFNLTTDLDIKDCPAISETPKRQNKSEAMPKSCLV